MLTLTIMRKYFFLISRFLISIFYTVILLPEFFIEANRLFNQKELNDSIQKLSESKNSFVIINLFEITMELILATTLNNTQEYIFEISNLRSSLET